MSTSSAMRVAAVFFAWLISTIFVILAIACAVILVVYGGRSIGSSFVLSAEQTLHAPSAFGTPAQALWLTLELVVGSVLIAFVFASAAAVAVTEPEIGRWAGMLVRRLLPLGTAMPAVAVGLAASAVMWPMFFFHRVFEFPVQFAVAALVVLNTPVMTARMIEALEAVPAAWRVVGAAAGASPLFVFFRVTARVASPRIFGAALRGAARTLGATAALALIFKGFSGPSPLAVYLWRQLTSPGTAPSSAAASEALVLVVAVVVIRLVAYRLERRRGKESAA